MAEKLASSRIDRILGLIDDALDGGPCWRCETRSGTQQSGLCDQCRDELRAEKAPPAAPEPWDGVVWSIQIPPGVDAITVGLRLDTAGFTAAMENVAVVFGRVANDVAELVGRTAALVNESFARDAASVSRIGDDTAAITAAISGIHFATDPSGIHFSTDPVMVTDPPIPRGRGLRKRKPPRTCLRHGVVMAGGLCRRCAR
jgi:hypothetical protein